MAKTDTEKKGHTDSAECRSIMATPWTELHIVRVLDELKVEVQSKHKCDLEHREEWKLCRTAASVLFILTLQCHLFWHSTTYSFAT